MQKSLRTLLLVALAITLCAATAQATLFQNGGFELPVVSPVPEYETVSGSGTITGWTAGGSGVDWIGTYWQNHSGVRSLDMNSSAPGSISQTFDTVNGQKYQVDFWMAGNPVPGHDPVVKTMTVSAASESAPYSFNTAGHDTTLMGWVKESFSFTANDISTTLTFASTNGGPCGPALDDVSVTAVPVPPAILLLGSGLLGLAVTRRGRRKA